MINSFPFVKFGDWFLFQGPFKSFKITVLLKSCLFILLMKKSSFSLNSFLIFKYDIQSYFNVFLLTIPCHLTSDYKMEVTMEKSYRSIKETWESKFSHHLWRSRVIVLATLLKTDFTFDLCELNLAADFDFFQWFSSWPIFQEWRLRLHFPSGLYFRSDFTLGWCTRWIFLSTF